MNKMSLDQVEALVSDYFSDSRDQEMALHLLDHYTQILEKGSVAGEAQPVAWFRKTDITEWTDTEPETDGWTPLFDHAAPQASANQQIEDAQERVALWPQEKRDRMRLEGAEKPSDEE